MELKLTWEAVLAIISILGFFSGVIALYVNYQFRSLVDDLVDRLDKRYVQSGDCGLKRSEISSRLRSVESKLNLAGDPED